MRLNRNIGVVIPALNEERAIGKVIADIPAWVDRIVVVDNGSRDRTAEVARAHGATAINEKERGYGAACQTGLAALSDADVIVFLDGDYSDYPDEMAAIVDPILAGECDFVVGSRRGAGVRQGALTPQQRFGNWLACRLMRLIWRTDYTDLGPFRAIDAGALRRLGMQDRNYGWTIEMQIKAALAGLKIREVEVGYRPRIGLSKVSGTVKGSIGAGVKILGTIARFAFAPRPTQQA
jgi:glycosyltransferase involved in cell wall biosynthesis